MRAYIDVVSYGRVVPCLPEFVMNTTPTPSATQIWKEFKVDDEEPVAYRMSLSLYVEVFQSIPSCFCRWRHQLITTFEQIFTT